MSSSESIPFVSGVGGAAAAAATVAAAEAMRLLDLVADLSVSDRASAAFLFLGWEEIVSML